MKKYLILLFLLIFIGYSKQNFPVSEQYLKEIGMLESLKKFKSNFNKKEIDKMCDLEYTASLNALMLNSEFSEKVLNSFKKNNFKILNSKYNYLGVAIALLELGGIEPYLNQIAKLDPINIDGYWACTDKKIIYKIKINNNTLLETLKSMGSKKDFIKKIENNPKKRKKLTKVIGGVIASLVSWQLCSNNSLTKNILKKDQNIEFDFYDKNYLIEKYLLSLDKCEKFEKYNLKDLIKNSPELKKFVKILYN